MTDVIHFDYSPLDEMSAVFISRAPSGPTFTLDCSTLKFADATRTSSAVPLYLCSKAVDPKDCNIELITEPQSPLLLYEAPDSPFLLQVQKDAFFVNWRRQSGTFIYPHFHTRVGREQGIWDRFVSEWEVFRTFCEKQAIGAPEVLACHLAYINHMVHGET